LTVRKISTKVFWEDLIVDSVNPVAHRPDITSK
jgi:hypothetical protein